MTDNIYHSEIFLSHLVYKEVKVLYPSLPVTLSYVQTLFVNLKGSNVNPTCIDRDDLCQYVASKLTLDIHKAKVVNSPKR